MSFSSFTRLLRFVPISDGSRVCIGEPGSHTIGVGVAIREGLSVSTLLRSGTLVLSSGNKTHRREFIGRLLSPIVSSEVETIRCIGLNMRLWTGSRYICLGY
ncbi:hypothetical protein COCMIDRAFT_30770 [Bipolaris oryzae ATCC 44560]|uniref:Uncharacterized protein n=1 Tax=Bipolaris oryzae ATCC 44560 TaxID=930090 RepID=W6YRY6_COCMI|nr:uncharacterized protein COCMIDRAFT_30770 [Bipolaris oryzae ATCC 44560]EUC40258.1 hypothetical protein COCMIDRAFT_30770 [Bipolaris oryzae ATCC 44560]